MNDDLKTYLESHEVTKLQLGCGSYPLDGWFNTDGSISKCFNGVNYLDVSRPFDIPDESFNYIYSEHLFEHLTYRQGKNMLNECYRILKPGGIIRLSTPNIEFLIDLYLHPEKEINKAYIEFDSKRTGHPIDPIYAINHFHTDWGHKIIYDPQSLTNVLNECGFKNIVRCKVGESSHESLNDIESHSKHFGSSKWDFNALQSMVFEAQK